MDNHELTRPRAVHRAGRTEEAVILLESLLAEEPEHALGLTLLAECQIRRHRPEAALQELDRAEAAGGVTARTARLRGDALYRQDRAREAARAYDEADVTFHTAFGVASAEPHGATRWRFARSRLTRLRAAPGTS